jgi:hypothetical protein
MDIEVKRASLDTMAITVQAMHVDGKQMTLAVFRQLPISEEEPDDPLWGTVRYPIKDQGDLWLVFSHDGKLYRRALDVFSEDSEEFDAEESALNEAICSVKEELQSLVKEAKNLPPADEIRRREISDRVTSLLNEKRSLEYELFEMRDDLTKSELPQLFIAV